MKPAKKFQIRSLLKGFLNFREQQDLDEAKTNLNSHPESGDIKYNLSTSGLNQGDLQEGLIEIGPKLDIQTGIDLLHCFNNISQPIKSLRIDLQGALTSHGAVIQTLLVIQKSCKVSGTLCTISGFSSELLAFFQMAGMYDLLVEKTGVESS